VYNGGGHNNVPNHGRERERDWEPERERVRERRASSDYDSDEGHMRRNKYRGAAEALNIIIIFGLTKDMTRADVSYKEIMQITTC